MTEHRLRWQIYPSFLLIIVLATGTITLLTAIDLERKTEIQSAKDLRYRAHLLKTMAGDGWWEGRVPESKQLSALIGDPKLRLTLIRADGVVVADSTHDYRRMENHGARPEVRQAWADGVGQAVRHSSTLGTDLMYVALRDDGRGVIRVARPLEDVIARVRALQVRMLFVASLTAVLAGLLAWRVGRKLSRPIEDLERHAERISRGDLDISFPSYETREFHSLARTMDSMARQLRERIHRVVTQRNEYQAVLEGLLEGVIAIDRSRRILSVNSAAASILAIPREGVIGEPIADHVRSPDILAMIDEAIDRMENCDREFVLFRPEERRIRGQASVLRGPQGEFTGVVAVINDMTRLHRLENVRKEFVANVSHELKTPITSIKGYVETLLEGAIDRPAEARRFLGIVRKHTDRLSQIIQDLLSLSRLDQIAQGVEGESVDLVKVARAAIQYCRVAADENEVKILLHATGSLNVSGDASLLEHAISNLVDNAVKYGAPRADIAHVEVSVERVGGDAILSVKDQGEGIPSEHVPRIFERFYRVDKARSNRTGGTGLGLAIVKHIAQAHHGRVEVTSELGAGSIFRILIPALPAVQEPSAATSTNGRGI